MVTEEEIIEHVKSLSYQDKIKLINKITPLKDFNNQKYRDKIMREIFQKQRDIMVLIQKVHPLNPFQ